jgi:pimeloyl-ACP methyl ester carboxylesterase
MMNTLVMIPAFGCDARLYGPQIKSLKKFIDVEVILAEAGSFEDMVEDLLSNSEGEFAILGTSMGGRLALEVALAAPGRVEALCVIGSGPGPVSDPAGGLLRSKRIRNGEKADVIAEMAAMIAHEAGPRGLQTRQAFIDMATAMRVEQLAAQSDALAKRVDRWEQLSTITCPAMFLFGEHDKFAPASLGPEMAEKVDYGSYVEVPACGHFPTLEYPDFTTDAILAWLDDAELI